MNPINIRFCKELWDNFDKCDHEADLTELSVMFVCSWGTFHEKNGDRLRWKIWQGSISELKLAAESRNIAIYKTKHKTKAKQRKPKQNKQTL